MMCCILQLESASYLLRKLAFETFEWVQLIKGTISHTSKSSEALCGMYV